MVGERRNHDVNRHRHADRNVHSDSIEVRVQEALSDWIHLPALQNCVRRTVTGNIELQNGIASGFRTEDLLQRLGIDGNRKVFPLSAINNSRYQTFPPQPARRVLSTIGAILRTDYNFSHNFPFDCSGVIS